MSTSSLACAICGESPDVSRIDWGCVVCNKDKERLARLPEVPVISGPVTDGTGCIPHKEVNCKRCAVLEFRHRTEMDPDWRKGEDGSWEPQRDGRGGWLTLLVLGLSFLLVVGSCFAVAWHYWPR